MSKMKQVLVIRCDLKMGRGKECAQAGHAFLGAYFDSKDRWGGIADDMLKAWEECSKKKVVVKIHSEEELLALAQKAEELNIGHYLVRDEGKTEVAPNTPTALALGPDTERLIDRVTGELKPY